MAQSVTGVVAVMSSLHPPATESARSSSHARQRPSLPTSCGADPDGPAHSADIVQPSQPAITTSPTGGARGRQDHSCRGRQHPLDPESPLGLRQYREPPRRDGGPPRHRRLVSARDVPSGRAHSHHERDRSQRHCYDRYRRSAGGSPIRSECILGWRIREHGPRHRDTGPLRSASASR